MRAGIILRHTVTVGIHLPKIVLGVGEAMVRSHLVPFHRLNAVLWYAPAGVVNDPQIMLGEAITLIRSLPKPLHRLGVVLRHTLAVKV